MNDKKAEFRFFTIPEWKEEEEYLRKRNQKGWMFTYVTFPGVYHFKRCEPEDVIYQLDYNKERIYNKSEYLGIFNDCGWEYIMDYVGYSYFRKPVSQMNGEENIFCNDESRLDMIKRVFKGRIIPLIIILFACIIPQLFLQWPRDIVFAKTMFVIFCLLLILYLYVFIRFGYQYYQLKKQFRKK